MRDSRLIAIINDDAAFVQILSTLLQDEGYRTRLSHAGDFAHANVEQQLPDLVILDIALDNPMASWQVIDLLALDPQFSTIPIIICTVADQVLAERQSKLKELGYVVVEKPFALDELLGHVRALLTRRDG